MSITPTGSMTAASCSACTWVANTAKSAGNAVVAGATKVANLVASTFQALAQYVSLASSHVKNYASLASSHARNYAAAGLNALKANPQVAIGSLAVVTIAAAAVYAYKQRAAV